MSRRKQPEPRVGIFWWFRNRIIADCTAVSIAERYGDCLTHATSHIDFWSELQRSRVVPAEVDYEEPSRASCNCEPNSRCVGHAGTVSRTQETYNLLTMASKLLKIKDDRPSPFFGTKHYKQTFMFQHKPRTRQGLGSPDVLFPGV